MGILERIESEKFIFSVGFELTPNALYKVLLRTEERAELMTSYKAGIITDTMLRCYIQRLLRGFKVGQRFTHDITLSFLSVALEPFSTRFADEFIRDLSKLDVSELSISTKVAKLCLAKRDLLPKTEYRKFVFSTTAIDTYKEIDRIQESVDKSYDRKNYSELAAA